MGYYNQLEISRQVEEPDRYVTRRQKTARRRETYRRPARSSVIRFDMVIMFAVVMLSFALGAIVTLLAVTS